MTKPLVLSYAGCGTCRKALKWLSEQKVPVQVRPILEQPPTVKELTRWVAASGLPVKKWLNTSGGSYRALGKAKVDAVDDATLLTWLAADGKLVKRPVLVQGETVLVGFKPEQYQALLG